ncbi:uncharacterized protein LOC120068017 isoform X2 [Benincasa hispida]|nr:uncharacterized protein LOC120068017 isoform X2 [Benincasa hispida]
MGNGRPDPAALAALLQPSISRSLPAADPRDQKPGSFATRSARRPSPATELRRSLPSFAVVCRISTIVDPRLELFGVCNVLSSR